MTGRSKRRWYQFSLRALLVFVLLASVGMSWLAVKLERARRQKEAVEAIEKAAGWVVYDYQSENLSAEPPVPRWKRLLLGKDFFFDVVWAELITTGFGDDEAAHLRGLTGLKTLRLNDPQFTDAGLAHLRGLTSLERLYLDGTQVTDAGLVHLEGMTNLQSLGLFLTPVTDAGLGRLRGLTKLEWLNLVDTQATPEGVKKLQEALPECQIHY
jgi:hypothetical protein